MKIENDGLYRKRHVKHWLLSLFSKSTTEEPGMREKWNILERLNTTSLVPSAFNRTPETLWLFYNRIPRSGGKTLVALMQALGTDLDVQHQEHVYRTPWER